MSEIELYFIDKSENNGAHERYFRREARECLRNCLDVEDGSVNITEYHIETDNIFAL